MLASQADEQRVELPASWDATTLVPASVLAYILHNRHAVDVLVTQGTVNHQLMVWHLARDKPLPEPMLTKMSCAICLDKKYHRLYFRLCKLSGCPLVFGMMTSNGNIRVTGPLWGESTGQRWIPLTKASGTEHLCFLWSAPEQTFEQTIESPVIWDTIALITWL